MSLFLAIFMVLTQTGNPVNASTFENQTLEAKSGNASTAEVDGGLSDKAVITALLSAKSVDDGTLTKPAAEDAVKAAFEVKFGAGNVASVSVENIANGVKVTVTANGRQYAYTFTTNQDGTSNFGMFIDSASFVESGQTVREFVESLDANGVVQKSKTDVMLSISESDIKVAYSNLPTDVQAKVTENDFVKQVQALAVDTKVNFRQLPEGQTVFADTTGRVAGAIFQKVDGKLVVDFATPFARSLSAEELTSVMKHEIFEQALVDLGVNSGVEAHEAVRLSGADSAETAWAKLEGAQSIRNAVAALAAEDLSESTADTFASFSADASVRAQLAEAAKLDSVSQVTVADALAGLSNELQATLNAIYGEGNTVVKGTAQSLAIEAILQSMSTSEVAEAAKANLDTVWPKTAFDSSVFGTTEVQEDGTFKVKTHSYNAKALVNQVPADKKIVVAARQGVDAFKALLVANGLTEAQIAKFDIVDVSDVLENAGEIVNRVIAKTGEGLIMVNDMQEPINGLSDEVSKKAGKNYTVPRGADLLDVVLGLSAVVNSANVVELKANLAKIGYSEAEVNQFVAEFDLAEDDILPPTRPLKAQSFNMFNQLKLQMAVERYA